jgi:hypothetical protein
MLTTNMHILDVYFVKYTESRIAAFQEALVSSESEPAAAPVFPIDKFLSETKPAAVSAEKIPFGFSLESPLSLSSGLPPDKAEHLSQGLLRDTVLVKEKEEPMEPPAIDLRTGIITVSQEEPKQAKPAETRTRPDSAKAKPAAGVIKKKPVLAPKNQPHPFGYVETPPPAAPGAEDAFDFEKEISTHVGNAMQEDLGQGALHPVGYGEAPDTKALYTEKTMRWDRDELKGMAGKPESIVVEGTEQVKADKPEGATKPAGTNTTPQPGAKGDDAIFSGEDIENTLDSFFGLGDK